jgi:hypothetical protein
MSKNKPIIEEEIFWLDTFKGKAVSGYFVRNPLIEFFKKCEVNGLHIVAIKKPTDYNLEVIVEKTEDRSHER